MLLAKTWGDYIKRACLERPRGQGFAVLGSLPLGDNLADADDWMRVIVGIGTGGYEIRNSRTSPGKSAGRVHPGVKLLPS